MEIFAAQYHRPLLLLLSPSAPEPDVSTIIIIQHQRSQKQRDASVRPQIWEQWTQISNSGLNSHGWKRPVVYAWCSLLCVGWINVSWELFHADDSTTIISHSSHKPAVISLYTNLLVLEGLAQLHVVGQGSHRDGQLADDLEVDGPSVGGGNEGVHPPVGGFGQQVDKRLQETNAEVLEVLGRLHLSRVGEAHVALWAQKDELNLLFSLRGVRKQNRQLVFWQHRWI